MKKVFNYLWKTCSKIVSHLAFEIKPLFSRNFIHRDSTVVNQSRCYVQGFLHNFTSLTITTIFLNFYDLRKEEAEIDRPQKVQRMFFPRPNNEASVKSMLSALKA